MRWPLSPKVRVLDWYFTNLASFAHNEMLEPTDGVLGALTLLGRDVHLRDTQPRLHLDVDLHAHRHRCRHGGRWRVCRSIGSVGCSCGGSSGLSIATLLSLSLRIKPQK